MNLALDILPIALATHCPADKVRQNWPLLENALIAMCSIDSVPYTESVAIAALATIAVETDWRFEPIHELSGRGIAPDVYFEGKYGGRKDLGNTAPGDGAKYPGMGFIQRTGKRNYEVIGELLGVDLVHHPELEMNPVISAADFAVYFVRERPCAAAANDQNWHRVRTLVNGGTNGWEDFRAVVFRLLRQLHPETGLLDGEAGTL